MLKYKIDHELYEGLKGRELKEALWELYERAFEEGIESTSGSQENSWSDGYTEGYDRGCHDATKKLESKMGQYRQTNLW